MHIIYYNNDQSCDYPRLYVFTMQLDIWDTAGLEGFRTVTRSYYNGTQAAILVYNVKDSQSFYDLQQLWLKDVKDFAPNASVFLIGNKTDDVIVNSIDIDDGVGRYVVQEFMERNDIKMEFKVSVKMNQGLIEAFTAIATYLHTGRAVVQEDETYNKSIVLQNEPFDEDQNKRWCSC